MYTIILEREGLVAHIDDVQGSQTNVERIKAIRNKEITVGLLTVSR